MKRKVVSIVLSAVLALSMESGYLPQRLRPLQKQKPLPQKLQNRKKSL